MLDRGDPTMDESPASTSSSGFVSSSRRDVLIALGDDSMAELDSPLA